MLNNKIVQLNGKPLKRVKIKPSWDSNPIIKSKASATIEIGCILAFQKGEKREKSTP